ncbi:alpha/beta fold hydrolase [Polaromonas sp. CT11-55]|uniref:alpha/beta fold hydrolase n=1 Tax=Polaromonas sp. CT11-55 TaxID=3243045 RepID=UPI0039A5B300
MIETCLQALPHGISLSCRTSGAKGRPVLMFLHGFPEAAFVWDGLLEHFARPENGGFRCIAPNLRGFEQSSAPAEAAAYRPKHLVQDIAALIALEGGQLECLVAHDWGGAVAWNLAAGQPALMKKLAIINSPHPGTFLRELQQSPAQQAASAYMNFLIRPDAEALLAEDDFRRLWEFFTHMGAADGPHAWLTDTVREQYREVWRRGLTGPCNYYRASPLRPPRPGPPHNDPAAAAVTIPREMLEIHLPTLVLWAMDDIALPAALLDGLEDYVPQMTLQRIAGATHWIVHEQPALVAAYLRDFLR